jgi:hypothetical protein
MGETPLADIPGSHDRTGFVPAVAAANATEKHPVFRAPFACEVTKLHVVPRANVTGNDTNRKNLNVKKAATEIGNLDLVTGVDLAASVSRTISLTKTKLVVGETLDLEVEKVGTGVDLPDLHVEVEFVPAAK